jgi:hypothetical protein
MLFHAFNLHQFTLPDMGMDTADLKAHHADALDNLMFRLEPTHGDTPFGCLDNALIFVKSLIFFVLSNENHIQSTAS